MAKDDNTTSNNVLLEALKKKREKQGIGIYGEKNNKSGKKGQDKIHLKPSSSVSSSIGHRPTGR